MQKQLDQMKEFFDKFEDTYPSKPLDERLDKEIIDLRYKLMSEEVLEWKEASEEFGLEEKAKEIADVLYVVYGTILKEGLQDVIEKVFDEVHKSNMSKLGADGKVIRRADGKILKGENYKVADLSFLDEYKATMEVSLKTAFPLLDRRIYSNLDDVIKMMSFIFNKKIDVADLPKHFTLLSVENPSWYSRGKAIIDNIMLEENSESGDVVVRVIDELYADQVIKIKRLS